MTEHQIQQNYNQTIQDETTLDYAKWSAQRIQSKLSNDHELWKQERDAVLARRKRNNEAARASHLNNLETQRKAKQAEADAQIDSELEPEKRLLQNE